MCNCTQQAGEAGPGRAAPLTRERVVVMPIADRAVMCWVCPHARETFEGGRGLIAWSRRVWTRGGRWCDHRTADGSSQGRTALVEFLATGDCPRGRFAPRGGETRWLGLAWLGVPRPLRWLARLLGPRRVRSGQWRGCGCVKVLREAADRLLGSGSG